MPLPVDDTGDFEKLTQAFSALAGHFASVDDLMATFGLLDLPTAQKWGILFGCVTFVCTVSTVLFLLIFGGSFQRIAEQARGDKDAVISSDIVSVRTGRPLLYDRLLEAQSMFMKRYEDPKTTTGKTKLMELILNLVIRTGDVSDLADEDAAKRLKQGKVVPPGYQADYVEAFRKCQEKPGGAILNGRPEARFESYARSFAGCGGLVTRNYRRSYARLYESMCCQSHGDEQKFRELYMHRSEDLVGRMVRLEALEMDRHMLEFFKITCGDAYLESKSYDPNEIWGFLNYGPFNTPQEMKTCPIFTRKLDEAGFAIVENITDRLIGVIMLAKDDPQNLKITMEPPIIKPSANEIAEPIEAVYLLLDKLFALGYRRVEMTVDSFDAINKRMAARLGFTKEATIPKHMVIKDANRDSIIYGMLNSDWTKGARSFLYKKLHGQKLLKLDLQNNKKESQLDEQNRQLAEKRAQAAKASKK